MNPTTTLDNQTPAQQLTEEIITIVGGVSDNQAAQILSAIENTEPNKGGCMSNTVDDILDDFGHHVVNNRDVENSRSFLKVAAKAKLNAHYKKEFLNILDQFNEDHGPVDSPSCAEFHARGMLRHELRTKINERFK